MLATITITTCVLNWCVLAAMTTLIFILARRQRKERWAHYTTIGVADYVFVVEIRTKQNKVRIFEKLTKQMHEARTKCPEVNLSNAVPNVLALRCANCTANCCMAAVFPLFYLAVVESLREGNAWLHLANTNRGRVFAEMPAARLRIFQIQPLECRPLILWLGKYSMMYWPWELELCLVLHGDGFDHDSWFEAIR